MKHLLPSLLLLLLSAVAMAEDPDSAFLARKRIEAQRIAIPPKIDGKLDEAFWSTLPVAGDFVQYSPNNGDRPCFPTYHPCLLDAIHRN